MKTELVQCSTWRTAKRRCAWACKIVRVEGGISGDYGISWSVAGKRVILRPWTVGGWWSGTLITQWPRWRLPIFVAPATLPSFSNWITRGRERFKRRAASVVSINIFAISSGNLHSISHHEQLGKTTILIPSIPHCDKKSATLDA